jgi:hypothetical protein
MSQGGEKSRRGYRLWKTIKGFLPGCHAGPPKLNMGC